MNEEMNQTETNEEPELVACPNCSQTNDPLAHFCLKCGAPLSSFANVGPWERTLSEGFAYRQAVSGPPKRIILAGMWFLFGPALIISCFCLFTGIRLYNGFDGKGIVESVAMLVMAVVCAVLLFRTTRNYICKKRMVERTPGGDSSTRADAGTESPRN
jgi:hypothetical protein